jgi:YHS domain-containing protein
MKRIFILLLASFILFSAPVAGFSAKDVEQSKCPIMGGPPNPKYHVDYKGKRIYFCCPPCIDEFKKNPDLYLKMLEQAGIELEDAPEKE